MSQDKEAYLSTAQEHAWAEEQIPWLVNETLGDGLDARLQRHLDQCKICREDLHRQQQVRNLLLSKTKVDYAPQASWQRMQITLERRGFLIRWCRGLGKIFTWQLPRINFWQALIGTQALTVLVLAAVVYMQYDAQVPAPMQADANYETLTSSNLDVGGPHLQVVFDAQLSATNIRQILAPINAVIDSGPSAQGIFRVRVNQVEDIQKHADWLTTQPGVVFVAVQGK